MMSGEINQNLIMALPTRFMTLELVYAVASSYTSRRNRVLMTIIIALLISVIFQNVLEYRAITDPTPNIQVRIALAVFGYVVRPIIIVMFIEIVSDANQILMPTIESEENRGTTITIFIPEAEATEKKRKGLFRKK